MRNALFELMSILADGAEVDDDCASQLAALAADAAEAGDNLIAAGLINIARSHRIHALQLRSRFAALSVQHKDIFSQRYAED